MGPPEQHGRERSRCRETQSRQQARPSEFDRSASLREWNEECKEISTLIGDECFSERQRPADDSYSTIQNGNIEKVDCECQDENSSEYGNSLRATGLHESPNERHPRQAWHTLTQCPR